MAIADGFGQLQSFRNQIAAQTQQNYFAQLAARRAEAQMLDQEDEAATMNQYREQAMADERARLAASRDMQERELAQRDYFGRTDQGFRERQAKQRSQEFADTMDYNYDALDATTGKTQDREQKALFGQIYGEISKGGIRDKAMLASIAKGNVSDQQYESLLVALGNAQGKMKQAFDSGAGTTADELTSEFTSSPEFPIPNNQRNKYFNARLSSDPTAGSLRHWVTDAYKAQTGVDPETDPNLSEDALRNIIKEQGGGFFPFYRKRGAAQAEVDAALRARSGKFNAFVANRLKDRSIAGQVAPDSANYRFVPRQLPPEDLDAVEYGTTSEARRIFGAQAPAPAALPKFIVGKRYVRNPGEVPMTYLGGDPMDPNSWQVKQRTPVQAF